jgi:hypothetical protein
MKTIAPNASSVGIDFQEESDEEDGGKIDQLSLTNNVAMVTIVYQPPERTLDIRRQRSTTIPIEKVADVVLNAIRATVDGITLKTPLPSQVLPVDNVYVYAGHGTDICDTSGNVVTNTVPEGCVYITLGECGKTVVHNESEKISRALIGQGLAKLPDDIFQIPFTDEKRGLLASAIGIEPGTLHVHNPGDDYVVSSFFPIAYWNRLDNRNMLGPSGLRVANKLNCIDAGLVTQYIQSTQPKPRAMSVPQFKQQLLTLPKRPFLRAIVQKGLFDEIFNKELTKRKTDLKFGTVLGFQHEELVQDLSEYVDHDTLLEFFCGSVCPTPEQVKTVLAKYENPMRFRELYALTADIKKHIAPETSQMTSTFLMETFPGVHLNLVCRSVDETCKPAAEARRSVSRSRYGTPRTGGRRKTNRKHKTRKTRRR